MLQINRNIVLSISLLLLVTLAYGQQQHEDSTNTKFSRVTKFFNPSKELKNSLMVNVTNPLLISSKFFTITYERILPNNQSFTVGLGTFSLPTFVGGKSDSLGIEHNDSETGFHFSGDYRFYLKKLNRHNAPRGVYIGPYYTYNHLNRGNTWTLNGNSFQGEVNTDLTFNIHTIGFQLGYQFVFWNRLAVDFILLGPGYGNYGIKTNLNTSLSPQQEIEFFEKLNEYLQDRIPGFEWVIKPGEFKKKGSFDIWTLGYRYTIKVGFRF